MAMVLKSLAWVLGCSLVILGAWSYTVTKHDRPSAGTPTPRDLARQAYYQMEAHVFDRAQLQEAYTKINQAADQNRNEAFIYVAVSFGTLIGGYTIGDWYDLDTFSGDTVQQALGYAQQAVALDPNLGAAHAQLARVLVVRREFEEAARHIATAKVLDPDSFYPQYFEGIWHEKQGLATEANQAFDRAQHAATLPHHSMLVLGHRTSVAKVEGNAALQEQLLKEGIGLNPKNAYAYGEYAAFLMCKGRYRDAIVQWEQAIRIAPFPRAVSQLEKAKAHLAQEPTTLVQAEVHTGCG